jgi:DNA-binding transcriptional regulator YiaG
MGGTQRARLIIPKKTLPRIAAVTAGEKALTLRIRWDAGDESQVDVSGLVETFRVYEPLHRSPELFARVRVGEYGADVVWSDDIDMSADTLWRLAREQTGATMSPDEFRRWRESKAYTLDAAARALGLSRRMVVYYEQGAKPIPRVVALATRGLEHV